VLKLILKEIQTVPLQDFANQRTFPALTGIRALLAISILLLHSNIKDASFVPDALRPYLSIGLVAVSFFFTISGFVLMHAYGNRFQANVTKVNLKPFFQKRFKRLYPIYFIAMVALLILEFTLNSGKAVAEIPLWIVRFLAIQAWSPTWVDGPGFFWWTITTVFFLTAIFPFLVKFVGKIPANRLWAVTLATSAIPVILGFTLATVFGPEFERATQPQMYFYTYFPVFRIPGFLIGMLAHRIITEQKVPTFITKFPTVFAIATIALVLLLSCSPYKLPFMVYSRGGLALLFAMLIVTLVIPSKFANVMQWKPFVVVGSSTYVLYVTHGVVLDYFNAGLNHFNIYKSAPLSILSGLICLTVAHFGNEYSAKLSKSKALKKPATNSNESQPPYGTAVVELAGVTQGSSEQGLQPEPEPITSK
jgi:peptidoglycan/LPS O-acetylase OafA/YrhL